MISKKFNKREKALLLVFAVLLIATTYYQLIFKPTRASVKRAEEKRVEVEEMIEEEQAVLEEQRKMEAALESIDYGKEADYVTPLYDNTPNVIPLLNSALSKTIDYDLRFMPVTFSDNLAMREIQMTFAARNYASARDIVTQIASGPYSCDISLLKMDPVESDVEILTMGEVKVVMYVIYYEIYLEELEG